MTGGGFAMVLFGVLMVLGLVLLGVVLVRVLGGGLSGSLRGDQAPERRGPEAERSARQILDERYARGDLSSEDYQTRLHVLRGEK
jgi:putative membrane protein